MRQTSSYTGYAKLLAVFIPLALAGLAITACADLTTPPDPEAIGAEKVAEAATNTAPPPAASSAAPTPTPTAAPPSTTDKVTIVEMAPGKGSAVAKDGDKVEVLYKGSLTNGTVFDESKAHGNTPLPFSVGGGVIRGFSDGVRGMKLGGKRKVTIPPTLGYGAASQGKIPANSTLIFEIELVKLNGQSK